MMRLRTKMSLSYLLIGLLCLFLMAIIMNTYLERLFINYVMDNQSEKNRNYAEQIAQQLNSDGSWDVSKVELIGISALEEGLILKVTDHNQNIVWDATLYNSGMCESMISHMSQRMMDRNPNWEGEVVHRNFPVDQGGVFRGTVQVSYYGPYYYSEADEAFIETINMGLLVASVFAALLAFVVGTIMAARISKPIAKVVQSANMISEGHYDVRSNQKTYTHELNTLVESINQLAETLENQEKLRRRMTSDIAHELRTPLTTLQSHMEAMIDGIWNPDVQRLESCHDEILRLTHLVGDLENLAKIERTIHQSDMRPVDFNALVEQQVLQFQAEFLKHDIELVYHANQEPFVMGNRDQLSQIVVNLLSNALKYSNHSSTVTVTLNTEEPHMTLTVADEGQGIAEEDLPFIFERFYRADPSRNRDTGGTGIGLTISKTIAVAHNGHITVSSQLGKGSIFTLDLPMM